MNKYQLYTLGGALLAATSLSGTASAAGTVGAYTLNGGVGSTVSATPIYVSNAAFSTTASTANSVQLNATRKIAFSFLNTYNSTFNLNITVPITGATFSGTAPTVSWLDRGTTGSFDSTIPSTTGYFTVAPTVSALANTLFISNVQLTSTATIGGAVAVNGVGGFVLNTVSFGNGSGLATAGGSITLAATIASQASQTLVYETIAASPVVVSKAPLATTVSSGATTVAVGTAPNLFTTLSGSSLSLTLATVSITATGTTGTDLSMPIDADGQGAGAATGAAAGSVSVTLTSAALSDAAVTKLTVNAPSNVAEILNGGVTQITPAGFTSGSVTFTLSQGTSTYGGSFQIRLSYDGSTAISQVSTAGTVSVAFATSLPSVVAVASASGSAGTISRGGLSTEVNWANAGSGSGFTSFVRIHNKGTTAATATVVVKKDVSDHSGSAITTLGTFTSDTIAAGGTIQVGVPTIESSLGINSSTASGSYTLVISGGFPGYVQHLSYNGSSLFDLSGFRNGSDGTNSAP